MKQSKSSAGFTLLEMMIVLSIIGLLAAIAIPSFVHARQTSQSKACINNLRQIDAAKQQWALDMRRPTNAVPQFSDVSSYLRGPVVCPTAGDGATFDASYELNDVSTKPACKISPGDHLLLEN